MVTCRVGHCVGNVCAEFLKGPNTEEFQLVADSVSSLRSLVAKIAEGLPAQDAMESTSQMNNVCSFANL